MNAPSPPRLRVGFVVNLDPTWLGGLNYFRNLITAVYDDPQRAIDAIFFVARTADLSVLEDFPEVTYVRTPLLEAKGPAAFARRIAVRLARRDVLLDRLLVRHRIDVLSHSPVLGPAARTRVAYWIPDFQHIHLPDHFTAQEHASRNAWFARVCDESDVIVLSSEQARSDLLSLYPKMAARSRVLRFVPQVGAPSGLPARQELAARHGLQEPFFYLPNQYWAHKNHRLVVEALGLLKSEVQVPLVVSTGSPVDYRNPDHYRTLCERISELGLDERFVRLGVVPYRDLLGLMRDAVAVINPSLFEGWSTTVEEARAMGKRILLSDIPTHREQAPAGGVFFDPHDPASLADVMRATWNERAQLQDAGDPLADHVARRTAFSRRYHQILDEVAHA